jgi:Ca-activated chloride channel family protein
MSLLTHSLTLGFALPGLDGNYLLQSPEWLPVLLLVPLMVWLRERRRTTVFIIPHASAWHRRGALSGSRWPAFAALLGTALLVLALARPQRVDDRQEVRSKGYDLMLAIDLSGSMLSEDYVRDGHRINRLDAIKPVIQAFVNNRPNDRIGIVVFAGRAYTLAPLTLDHEWLARQLERLQIGVIEDGTAIGDGLGIALTRLEQAARQQDGQRLGAFVVLLTDGANNRGSLHPMQAAEIAQSRRIPVYTIGAGKEGYVLIPVARRADGTPQYDRQFSQLDEGLLRTIASQTGGSFFRADETRTIESAFRDIDRAQKIDFQARSHLLTTELFPWFAAPGVLLLLVSALATRPARSQPAPAPSAA